MAEVPGDPMQQVRPDDAPAQEDSVALPDELIDAINAALEEEDQAQITALIEPLHVADLADLLEFLTRDQREQVVKCLGAALDPEVLVYLDPAVREDVIEELGPRGLARALSALDSDDAAFHIRHTAAIHFPIFNFSTIGVMGPFGCRFDGNRVDMPV